MIRAAVTADAPGIGAVHVASWRSTYAGVLPDAFLARLSVARQAHYYDRSIRMGAGVFVAVEGTRVVGFTTARMVKAGVLGDGEIETLYVLDDFKDAGVGRALLRAAGGYLAGLGCAGAFAWVLRDNPAVFFYERVGGKRAAVSVTNVGGEAVAQTAFTWNPIGILLEGVVGGREA